MNSKPSEESAPTRVPAWTARAVPAESYADIERALASPDSPVGIDAKHTHILILHALDRIEQRLAGVRSPSAGEDATPVTGELLLEVQRVLEGVPAVDRLSSAQQKRISREMATVLGTAAGAEGGGGTLPGYVAELLEGVFEAIVNASIAQMEAYADLLEGAGASLNRFANNAAAARNVEPARQKLLATMVLMGINRVVVQDGRLRVRSVFDEDTEEDD